MDIIVYIKILCTRVTGTALMGLFVSGVFVGYINEIMGNTTTTINSFSGQPTVNKQINATIKDITFERHWKDNNRYRVSSMIIEIESNIDDNLYYHGLDTSKCILFNDVNNIVISKHYKNNSIDNQNFETIKPYKFRLNSNVIYNTVIIRNYGNGKKHSWNSIWAANIKPNDHLEYISNKIPKCVDNLSMFKSIDKEFVNLSYFIQKGNTEGIYTIYYIKNILQYISICVYTYIIQGITNDYISLIYTFRTFQRRLDKKLNKWGKCCIKIDNCMDIIKMGIKRCKKMQTKPKIEVSCPLCNNSGIDIRMYESHVTKKCKEMKDIKKYFNINASFSGTNSDRNIVSTTDDDTKDEHDILIENDIRSLSQNNKELKLEILKLKNVNDSLRIKLKNKNDIK